MKHHGLAFLPELSNLYPLRTNFGCYFIRGEDKILQL
jgi:hypothetical protein